MFSYWLGNNIFSGLLIKGTYYRQIIRGFITFLCRRSVGVFSRAFLVFLMKESKKRRRKQPGKLMAKSRSQPVNLPCAWPLMNPLDSTILQVTLILLLWKLIFQGFTEYQRWWILILDSCFLVIVCLQLRLNSAPMFMHFPPKGKPKKADTYDIQRYKTLLLD